METKWKNKWRCSNTNTLDEHSSSHSNKELCLDEEKTSSALDSSSSTVISVYRDMCNDIKVNNTVQSLFAWHYIDMTCYGLLSTIELIDILHIWMFVHFFIIGSQQAQSRTLYIKIFKVNKASAKDPIYDQANCIKHWRILHKIQNISI